MYDNDLDNWMANCSRSHRTVWALLPDESGASTWREHRVLGERGKACLRFGNEVVTTRYWRCVEEGRDQPRDLLAAQCHPEPVR